MLGASIPSPYMKREDDTSHQSEVKQEPYYPLKVKLEQQQTQHAQQENHHHNHQPQHQQQQQQQQQHVKQEQQNVKQENINIKPENQQNIQPKDEKLNTRIHEALKTIAHNKQNAGPLMPKEPKKPRKNKKRKATDQDIEKPKRQPSAYNIYMKETLEKFRSNPETAAMSHQEKFTIAATMWKSAPENPQSEQNQAAIAIGLKEEAKVDPKTEQKTAEVSKWIEDHVPIPPHLQREPTPFTVEDIMAEPDNIPITVDDTPPASNMSHILIEANSSIIVPKQEAPPIDLDLQSVKDDASKIAVAAPSVAGGDADFAMTVNSSADKTESPAELISAQPEQFATDASQVTNITEPASTVPAERKELTSSELPLVDDAHAAVVVSGIHGQPETVILPS